MAEYPAVLSTFGELEALPLGSIITSGEQVAIKTRIEPSANDDDRWHVTGGPDYEVETPYLFPSHGWTVLRLGGPRE